MRPAGGPLGVRFLLGIIPLLGGCVYYNGLYNASHLFDEAERMRRAGGESEAMARYAEVADKALRSYQKDAGGRWADDALLLAGRAYLRQGDLDQSRTALERALSISSDPELRAGALLYLGVVTSLSGEPDEGVVLLTEALLQLPPGAVRAEGHLWRARILLSAGFIESGWWDLLRVAEEHPSLGQAADLELLGWGLAYEDTIRARSGAQGLLRHRDGSVNVDSLHALVNAAKLAWGPAPAARLLRGAENAPWPPAARDGTLLLRAALEAEGGQDDLARADAGRVAAGTGPRAAQARLWLAALELSRVESVSDFDRIRPIVLPAVGAEDVLPLIEALRTVELLERRAEEQSRPIALFAAAEVARDALGAHRLAISLFVRYADADPNSPWIGKALLAALALAPEGPEWDALFERAEALPGNLYVNHARGRLTSSAQFEEVERDLGSELAAVLEGVSAMARERDVLVRDRSATGVPPQE